MPQATGVGTEQIDTHENVEEVLPRQFGKYTLLRRIGAGGMAEIFLAQLSLAQNSAAQIVKPVVIKRIHRSRCTDQAYIDMLLNEARIASTLSHPNIVQIFEVGCVDGDHYIAMEYIHGADLRVIVQRMGALGLTDFPLEHALAIVVGVCEGLAYAHEKLGPDGRPHHIVHRDISPQNVLVSYLGEVKVVDFGLAKFSDRIGEATQAGHIKGKIAYMSPEQASGEDVDWRSDIFSLGINLFELTTCRHLFKGRSDVDTLRLISSPTYPSPAQVKPGYPPRLDAIVTKAISKDRNRRYQSARHMLADLVEFIREENLRVSNAGLGNWLRTLHDSSTNTRPSSRRNHPSSFAIVLVASVLIACAASACAIYFLLR